MMDVWSLRPASVDPEPDVVQMGNVTDGSEPVVPVKPPEPRVKRKYVRRIQIEKEQEDG